MTHIAIRRSANGGNEDTPIEEPCLFRPRVKTASFYCGSGVGIVNVNDSLDIPSLRRVVNTTETSVLHRDELQ